MFGKGLKPYKVERKLAKQNYDMINFRKFIKNSGQNICQKEDGCLFPQSCSQKEDKI